MLPANLNNALQLSTRLSKTLITADAQSLVAKVEVGQQLKGAVQSQVGAGLYKVIVAGQSMQMRLPDFIRAGDVLDLQVVALQPQLKFSMSTTNAPVSTREQIGATARLLADLAQLPVKSPLTRQLSQTAVWQIPGTTDTKQLASSLRDALGNSGLFYESHQAQWVRGERSAAQLLVEPQNQLVDNRVTARSNNQTAVSALGSDTLLPSTTTTQSTDTSSSSTASPQTNSTPVAKELLPLVQQQLHTLETHQLTWAGPVWPGQEMQWEIQGEPHQQAVQADERHWSTEMELALPKLGDVHAKLVFTSSGLKLTLQAADVATLTLFNRALPQLQTALIHADIPLSNTSVEHT